MVAARLHGALLRAVEFARFSRDEFEAATARCALAARGRPAVIVDASMNLIEANEEAHEMIVDARLLRHRNGRLSFANRQLDDLIGGLVRDLCRSPYARDFERRWAGSGASWVFKAVRLPGSGSMAATILPARSRIMLLMQNLMAPRQPGGDLGGLADLFRLTPAEIRLCTALAGGLSLAEAAVRVGITNETARSQIKAIFPKTGTRGQADLRVLLERYLAS
jgi:DNA-binding CsgD family transcriptional regulator